jgi:uncharacterized protein YjbK
MATGNLEIELKLLIDESGHQNLLKQLQQDGPTLQQTNHFFDTPQKELRSNLWALRCRKENDQLFLTCKGPSFSSQDGVSSRTEIEAPTSPDVLSKLQLGCSLSDIDHPAAQHLINQFGPLSVEPLLSFHNERQRLPWEEAMIELDHSTCLQQHRYEIELEGSHQQIKRWAPSLEECLREWNIPFTRATDTKLKWASSLLED